MNDAPAKAAASHLDPNHALDVMQVAGAPWWGIAAVFIIFIFFIRGPAVIRAINELVKTQRQLTHRHRTNMEKLRGGSRQRLEQQPPQRARRSGREP